MQDRPIGIDDFLREADRLARERSALEGRAPAVGVLLPGEDLGSPSRPTRRGGSPATAS